jgi:hypothetical protein
MDPSRVTTDAAPSWRSGDAFTRSSSMAAGTGPQTTWQRRVLKAFLGQHVGDHQLPDGVS